MTIELVKKYQGMAEVPTNFDTQGNEIAWEKYPVMLWKFKDQDGNLWNTETPIDGTEEDAASIILASVVSA